MRLQLYSADSYGLGHVRRSLEIAERVVDDFPGACARVITGAPRAHYFRYPEGVDYVKMPAVTKDHAGRYASRNGERTLGETVELRSRLIDQATALFRPDVVYVDHVAQGLCGELEPTFRRLRRMQQRPLRLLGLRDIIDEPDVVREAWSRNGIFETMRKEYDHVIVFGQPEVLDPVSAYGIPDDVARKMSFVGYIPRRVSPAGHPRIRSKFAPRTGKLVTITMGGGGDGNLLLRTFLEGYEALGRRPPFEVAAITGPLMSPRKRARFADWADRLDGVSLLDYCPSLPELIGASDFVVSMAGYNTVCELACASARALLVPRTFPRKEQLVRARKLADRGVTRYAAPESLTPRSLINEILGGLESARPATDWGLRLTGLDRLSGLLGELRVGTSVPAMPLRAAGTAS